MGPGVLIPAAASALAALFGLNRMGRADEIIRQLGQPGYLPGTTGPGEDLVHPRAEGTGGWNYEWINALSDESQPGWVNSLNEIARTNPAAGLGYATQMEENFTNRAYQQERAGEVVNMFTGAKERTAAFGKRGQEIGGKIEGLGDEAKAYAEAIIKDPNAISQREMDAMVGRMIGESNDVFAARGRQLETSAAGRGLSPSAVAAMQEQQAAENYRANLQSVASVAAVNAAERAKIKQAALDSLMGVKDIYGRGAGVEALYEGLVEGGESNLANATYAEASTHQPLDYMLGPELGYESSIAQAMREANLSEEQANFLLNLSSGFLGFTDSQLGRKATMSAQGGGGLGGWGSALGSSGAMAADLGLLLASGGTLTPELMPFMMMTGALGGTAGSMFD